MELIRSLQPLLEHENVILGLDAYGVMYNGQSVFDTIKPLLITVMNMVFLFL